jgi:hypothetical protein
MHLLLLLLLLLLLTEFVNHKRHALPTNIIVPNKYSKVLVARRDPPHNILGNCCDV